MYHGEKIRELPNLSTTRWWARVTSCKNLLSRFQCAIQLLRNVSLTDKGARTTTARGLLSQLNSEFLHLLYFFENILTKVNKVSEQIQGTNIDLGAACALKDNLADLRATPATSDFAVGELCKTSDIDSQERPRWDRSIPANLTEYVTADSIGRSRTTNPEVRGYSNVYLQLLARLLAELEKRFSIDAEPIMRGISALTPTSEEFLNHAYLWKMASIFDVCPDELKHEIPLVKKLVKEAQTVKDFLVQLCP